MPKIGSYSLYSIETGRFGLDGGAMFGIVPKPLWSRRTSADDRNRIPLNMRCLLLEGQGRVILVDNGLGEKYDDKFAQIYAIDETYPTLRDSLQRAGFSEEDVTDVVLTHLHFDHCGGSTRRTPKGYELVFTNARYHVQRAHWDWALDPNLREQASFLHENIGPLGESGQLSLLDGRMELFPGIELILVNGHTESQQLVKVMDEETTLLYVADLLPTTAHIRLPWIMAYDVRPLVTLEEKARLLREAADGGWHFFFEHDPEIAVATAQDSERGIDVVHGRSLEEL